VPQRLRTPEQPFDQTLPREKLADRSLITPRFGRRRSRPGVPRCCSKVGQHPHERDGEASLGFDARLGAGARFGQRFPVQRRGLEQIGLEGMDPCEARPDFGALLSGRGGRKSLFE